ncbi:recombinase family protein [Ruminococcaceae bacterium OttesenSCG-928-I18]|nr:recombinase family protein [Ruminococcaceae bacterium OttesenSCG-928-I18]
MKQVYGYFCVESKEHSLKTQKKSKALQNAIEKYCRMHGLELVCIFSDIGISTQQINRPKLAALLASLNEGQTIVVPDTKHLWDDDISKAILSRALRHAHAKIMSMEEPEYSLQKDHDLVRYKSIYRTLEQYDHFMANIKLSKGRREKAYTGNKASGAAPLGYEWAEDGSMQVDEEQAALVREIFEGYLTCGSLGKLIKHLDKKDEVSKRGNSFSKQELANILHNTFYIGIVTHGDICVPGKHQPIIDEPLYDSVQIKMQANRK